MSRRVSPANYDESKGLPLFAAVPFSNPSTSRAAAESMKPLVVGLELAALRFIEAAGERGATCEEIEDGTRLAHQTASARLRGLVIKGAIKDSGMKRPNRSKRMAIAWVKA